MSWSIPGLAVLLAVQSAAGISGTVVDEAGRPLPQAWVFMERGLHQPVTTERTGGDGSFSFANLEPGIAGIVAYSDGRAFGGQTITLSAEEQRDDVRIQLGKPTVLRGTVQNDDGDAVQGARIMGIVLLGESKVSVHFPKLQDAGIRTPVSGEDGRFQIPNVPQGIPIAMKVAHRSYAMEAVPEVVPGDQPARVTLHRGVLLRGQVQATESGEPVANAMIQVQHAQPPYESSVATTDRQGSFTMQLKPGVYMYQAIGRRMRSAARNRLTITGESPEQRIKLTMGELGTIRGKVLDAVSGAPVKGARLELKSGERTAGYAYTGPSGAYQFDAVSGDNEVRFLSAQGYLPPDPMAYNVPVKEGETFEAPDMWVVPIPDFKVDFVDEAGNAVPETAVRILAPKQFGWRQASSDGSIAIKIASMPDSGNVIGYAEQPNGSMGALFSLGRKDASGATVQLLPLSTVTGRVTTKGGSPLRGAVIGLLFTATDSAKEPDVLARTLTGRDGTFRFGNAVPRIPFRCVVYAGDSPPAYSSSFILEMGEDRQLEPITVDEGKSQQIVEGQRLEWEELEVVCGTLPSKQDRRERPAVVIYCSPNELEMVLDYVQSLRQALGSAAPMMPVVASGTVSCPGNGPLVLRGTPPTSATTYYLNKNGVVHRTAFGTPPLHEVRRFAQGNL